MKDQFLFRCLVTATIWVLISCMISNKIIHFIMYFEDIFNFTIIAIVFVISHVTTAATTTFIETATVMALRIFKCSCSYHSCV